MSTDVKTFTARESPPGGREDSPLGLKWNLTKHYGSRIPKGCGFPVFEARFSGRLSLVCAKPVSIGCEFINTRGQFDLNTQEVD